MLLSSVILPVRRWHEGGRAQWERAEQLGLHAAYTYDHLSWRSFRDRTWFAAVPTLTAAAAVTSRLRLGTLVTSPNFRHPVTLAKDLVALDDVSHGRITLGIGAGTEGFDATVLGQQPWPRRERADRFAEFVALLDELLREPAVTSTGTFYAAVEARNIPGCVQRPRLPFAVAATGPRGLQVAATHAQAWVTTGDPALDESGTPAESLAAVSGQLERLADACTAAGREVPERVFLAGTAPGVAEAMSSLDAFVDFAGRYAQIGITELVVHAPVPDSLYALDEGLYETLLTEAPTQLQ